MRKEEFKRYLKQYTIPELKAFYKSAKGIQLFLPQEISDEWRLKGLINVLYRMIVERSKKK